MQYDTLLYEVKDGIATISLNRPDRMNSIGGSMKEDLEDAFLRKARNDDAVRVIIFTGVGERAFCAGADIKERAGRVMSAAEYHKQQKYTHDLLRAIEVIEKPVIAALNGVALGGGLELALCADVRIAAAHARFGLPEAKLGVLPAAGGTQRLPRLVGHGWAKQLMLTAELIGAEKALQIGLVTEVVQTEALMPTAIAMAQQMIKNAPLSLRFIKQAVDLGLQTGIESGLEYERFAATLAISSEDRKEGMKAFVEKRTPVFTGK